MGCRATDDKGRLVRLVLRDELFVVDAAQREPGRGAYVHPGCAAKALRNRGVQRTLKVRPVPSEQLEDLLTGLSARPGV